jgi:hypothetical protein
MSDVESDGPERLVKSVERVRDIGEVFTPAATVQAMLDLLPATIWTPHPSPTFLEPACGDGNFLVAILARKLDAVAEAHSAEQLPAGPDLEALQFHALEALSSIYAVDISVDNVIGGTPGHEIGARERLMTVFVDWYKTATGCTPNLRSTVRAAAQWIISRNIVVGNMLATNADGTPSGRDDLPIVEYDWNPADRVVAVTATTLGAVLSAGKAETTGVMSLFDDITPAVTWAWPPLELRKAPITETALTDIEARNGTSRRTA